MPKKRFGKKQRTKIARKPMVELNVEGYPKTCRWEGMEILRWCFSDTLVGHILSPAATTSLVPYKADRKAAAAGHSISRSSKVNSNTVKYHDNFSPLSWSFGTHDGIVVYTAQPHCPEIASNYGCESPSRDLLII
jgi:hypothetical protein